MKKMSFEESITILESITNKLEAGNIPLEEALDLFQEGIELSKFCEKKLTEVEQKIEILKNCDINESDISDKKSIEIEEQNSEIQTKKPKKSKKIEITDSEDKLLF